jgi:protein-S-isoprenylcysteine O-methyltransferase Ste14
VTLRVSALVYRLRGVLVAPPVLAAALSSWGDMDRVAVAWTIGVTLFAVGWTVRIWAQRHVGYRLRRRKELTTCGPYAYVRNPIYLANGAMGVGAVIASETLWLVPVTLLWYAVVYGVAARHEERRLVAHYGAAYARYAAAIPRWLPAPARGPSCPHRAFGEAVLTELHTPLIMAPAAMKALYGLGPAVHILGRLLLA